MRVHKADADDWPSDLHAHSLINPREKLDLYTGRVYDAETHEEIRKLRPKQMLNIHKVIRQSGAEWAVEKLNEAHQDGNVT